MRARRLAAVAMSALLLAGCAEAAAPVDVDRVPTSGGDPLPEIDTADLRIPIQVEGVRVVDPGWDVAPQTAEGIALGFTEDGGVLRFTAVAPDGDPLWTVERPASCTGFLVTTAGDRALAVLTDTSTTEDSLAETTATAYDLATGEPVWGPVEVPGPLHGPGLVFAEPSTEAMGASGPRVALDPATGEVAAQDHDGTVVVGTYDDVLVEREEGTLVATDVHDGSEQWRVEPAERGWDLEGVVAAPGETAAPGTAVWQVGDDATALVDLDDGSLLAEDVAHVAADPTTGTVVTLEDTRITGTGPAGEELWAFSIAPGTTIAGVSGALVFLREGETVRAHNVVTGDVAEAYDPEGTGRIVVPTTVTGDGSVVLGDFERYYLATTATDGSGAP
ncbi:PQQ-binding-like beta-propeller repeat protein [Isoptericola halotolerans]|uniref:outer membrane protein assembly factor BamB family protein n=1 Tax=Isoptericola halotolerans TaxID=300560 RepID=UPI00388CF7F3